MSDGAPVRLIGGPFDGECIVLSATPRSIMVGAVTYRRLDDPDTGEFLGGYTYAAQD